jgi:uncharacterized protein YxeA
MKTLFSFLLLLSVTAIAQLSGKQLKELRDNTVKIESSRVQLESSVNRSMHVMDSINMESFNKQNEQNLQAFISAQKEREQKAKQRMYWRIGFGILMLIVLIIGLVRKRNK